MQENNIFLFMTITFVATSTGQGYVQRVKPHQYFNPSAIRAPLVSVSSTNGSSLEEIMKELDTGVQIQQLCGHFSAGSFGGGGGKAFKELPDNCGATIRRIRIRSGSVIDGIQIVYRLSNDQEYTGKHHGGTGGGLRTVNINTEGGERIIGVSGKAGGFIDQIEFVTNWGRILGPFGGCGGDNFKVNSCHVRGIFGRSAALLDSIGFFCSHPY